MSAIGPHCHLVEILRNLCTQYYIAQWMRFPESAVSVEQNNMYCAQFVNKTRTDLQKPQNINHLQLHN